MYKLVFFSSLKMCQPVNNLAFKEDLKNRFNNKRKERTSPNEYEAKFLKEEEDCEGTQSSLKTVTRRKDSQSFKGEFKESLDKKDHESSPKESESSSAAGKVPQFSKGEVCESKGTVLYDQVIDSYSWGKDRCKFLEDTVTLCPQGEAMDSPDEDVRDSSQREITEPSIEETSKFSEVPLCLVRASKCLEGETKVSTATKVSEEEATDSTEEKACEKSCGDIREFSHGEVSESSLDNARRFSEATRLLEMESNEAKASEFSKKEATESQEDIDCEISQGKTSESSQEDVSYFSDGETSKSLREEANEAKANEFSKNEATASPEKEASETSQGEINEFSLGETFESLREYASNFSEGEVGKSSEGEANDAKDNEFPKEETTESPEDEHCETSKVEISEDSEGAAQEEKATKEGAWKSKGKVFYDEETNYFWQRKILHFLEGVSRQSMNGETTDSPESSQAEISDSSAGAEQEKQATRFSREEVWESKGKLFYEKETNYSWKRKIFQFLEGVSTQSMSGEATDSPEEEYRVSSQEEISDSSEGAAQEENATKFSKGDVCESKEIVFYDKEANYSWQRKIFQVLEGVSTQSMSREATDSPEEEDLESSQGEISESSGGKDSESSKEFSSDYSNLDTSVANATLSSMGDTLFSSRSSDDTSSEEDSHSFKSLSSSVISDASTSENSSKSPSHKNGFFRCRIHELFDRVSRGMKGAFCLQINQED